MGYVTWAITAGANQNTGTMVMVFENYALRCNSIWGFLNEQKSHGQASNTCNESVYVAGMYKVGPLMKGQKCKLNFKG